MPPLWSNKLNEEFSMKKTFSLFLAHLCLLSLCACSQKEETPAATAAPVAETQTEAEAGSPTDASAEAPAETEAAGSSAYEQAKALEGESVEELLSALGEPLSREDYTPSCLGEGEDGLWHYEGFAVYTYREEGRESVYAVLEE